MKHKINLTTLPELKGEGIRIIRTMEQFKDFLGNLRQDWYSAEKLKVRDLEGSFQKWINRRRPFTEMFYVVVDEEDNFVKNDSWGGCTLYRAIAIRVTDEDVYVLKSAICEFSH